MLVVLVLPVLDIPDLAGSPMVLVLVPVEGLPVLALLMLPARAACNGR